MRLAKILLPVDFSERSSEAAHYSKALACRFHSEINLVHVFYLGELLAYANEHHLPVDWHEERKEQTRQALTASHFEDFRNVPVRHTLLEGDVAQAVVDYAHSEQSDLIVMPTHGYGPFRRFVLGSVTAKVLHDADCPVLTGVHIERSPLLEPIFFRNVICAVDFDTAGDRAYRWASDFAAEFQARLTLVHALPVTYASDDPGLSAMLRDMAQQKADELRKAVGANAELILESGSVAAVVRNAAAASNADLVVIGRHENPGLLGRLREHSYAIVRESPCPVVSV
jgi:nucleotide-binding universal stress UspA family protein